jgi:predicted nucleic acid-binding protein
LKPKQTWWCPPSASRPLQRFAIAAAQLSHTLRLPMADSIILATTRAHQARLYTLGADFKGLHDVELMQRP